MAKISKALKIIREVSRRPKSLAKVLEDDAIYRRQVTKRYPAFSNGFPVVDICDLFPGLDEKIEYGFLEGTSFPLDLVLLKKLAQRSPDCIYLEIGTWRGESVRTVAGAARECYSVNLPDDTMRQMGLPEEYIRSHRFFSKGLPNVNHVFADSQTFDFSSIGRKFDLVFIDGDHHFESVKRDTASLFPLLNDERSVMVWHDYLFPSGAMRWEVMNAILDGLAPERHAYLYHVSNTLCAAYIPQRLKTRSFDPYAAPEKVFELSIRARKL
ncbi:MAG: class I SAM-dependent methyltransferase [Bacteroidota bacterium]